ncbi:MAG: ornithine carbamoyltransferase, catabolic [Pseudomonadota bacterium]|jgi:ornithine carbamoyltransferase
MAIRHFLSLLDLTPTELQTLLQRAIFLKQLQKKGSSPQCLKNKVLGMIFEKSSTRTRVSFESAMAQCGGHAIFLSPKDTQLGRGEPVEDTARVLSGMIDGVIIRTYHQETIEKFAAYARIPVINALTDAHHPCQLLADIQTFIEYRGSIQGKRVAWIGDGFNMCNSFIHAAKQFDFELRIASPHGYQPSPEMIAEAEGRAELREDPNWAAENADLIVTDVWASMGQEDEQALRERIFAPYQVNANLMAKANSNALFMHCLPAHRGEEVTNEVIEGAQSVVWEEAANRLHAQKALLEFLLITQYENLS